MRKIGQIFINLTCKITYINIVCIILIISTSTLCKMSSNSTKISRVSSDLDNLNLRKVKKSRIVGGYPAKIGQFPHQISMQYNRFIGYNLCGGSILSRKTVLTAAHCAYGHQVEDDMVVVVGVVLLTSARSSNHHPITEFIIHPEWDPIHIDHDLAFLIVSNQFNYNDYVQPVRYATKPGYSMSCIATGFGVDDPDEKSTPGRLLALRMKLQSTEICKYDFPLNYNNISQICAGGIKGKDTCNGDSGGPLICNNILYGVVSYGTSYCAIGNVGVFVNVSYYQKWISSILEAYPNSATSEKNQCYFLFKKCLLIVFLLTILKLKLLEEEKYLTRLGLEPRTSGNQLKFSPLDQVVY